MLLENYIAYQNQTLSSEKLQDLLLSLKAQKTQDDSWFHCKQVYEMPLRALPESVVYQGQVLIFIFSIVCFLLQYELRIYFNIKLFFICGVFFSLSKIFVTKKVASYEKFD